MDATLLEADGECYILDFMHHCFGILRKSSNFVFDDLGGLDTFVATRRFLYFEESIE